MGYAGCVPGRVNLRPRLYNVPVSQYPSAAATKCIRQNFPSPAKLPTRDVVLRANAAKASPAKLPTSDVLLRAKAGLPVTHNCDEHGYDEPMSFKVKSGNMWSGAEVRKL